MAKYIEKPAIVKAVGNKPKIIREYFGRVNSGTGQVSIAHMESPPGWEEPGQTPEFNEYTVVLEGELHVETRKGTHIVAAGQGIALEAGEWVRYKTPGSQGAKYIAVCLPAFSPETVHRDA